MPLNTRKMAGERDKGGTREDEMSKVPFVMRVVTLLVKRIFLRFVTATFILFHREDALFLFNNIIVFYPSNRTFR